MRLFWKFEDILLDVPKAPQFLAQILSFLNLRDVISASGILTQMPSDVREKIFAVDSFREHFEKEIAKISEEKKFRARAEELLKEFFSNYDDTAVAFFLSKEVKQHGWECFNHLFIRKAIDFAMDRSANDREACSKLLQACTHKFNF